MAQQLHHYVPRFYLRRFADPTQKDRVLIWIYERDKSDPELRPLDRIAAQKNYYTIKLADGTKSQEVEAALSGIEGLAAPALEKLVQGRYELSPEERAAFCSFLSLGLARVPKFRTEVEETAGIFLEEFSQRMASDPEKFRKSMEETGKRIGQDMGDPESLRQAVLEKRFKMVVRPEFSLQMMFANMMFIAEMIDQMQWSHHQANDSTPLVTSDNPVIFNNPTMLPGQDPPTPAALEVIMSLSPQHLFVATWDGRAGQGRMSPFLTRQINKLIALSADTYVYSPIQIPAIANFLKQPRKKLFHPGFLERAKASLKPYKNE